MTFPDILKIFVREGVTDRPVPHIALMLTLFAPKNNYHFPVTTDQNGIATIKIAEVEESISEDQKLFPMDYASNLEECKPELEISVCSVEEISRAIDAMRTISAVTHIPATKIDNFRHSSNHLYQPTSIRVTQNSLGNLKPIIIHRRQRGEM